MVSVTGLKALTTQNTLDLFKAQPQQPKTTASVLAPTVQVSTGDRLKTIASLAAKLIDLKQGGQDADQSDVQAPSRVGDGERALTAEERATERANFEAFYRAIDDDTRANFLQKVTDALLQNDLYKNDPSFQAALKEGTISVQSGKVIGFKERPREIYFDSNGYYAGVKAGEVDQPKDLFGKIENIGGRFVSKTNGQNVAIGQINGQSFYVTWPVK